MSAGNPDDYLDLVDQAILETDDLIACAQYEADSDEDFAGMLPVYQQLRAELEKLHSVVRAGSHAFGAGVDLPLMALVRRYRGRVPIGGLLEAINEIQRKGF
ncbi:MAG: hypothetical protein HY942_08360 [Gammaproteobacteria bacterium]|nr:hypothetical protein [Gammaproteobacteria bacterium]